jgi:hypothetical protein
MAKNKLKFKTIIQGSPVKEFLTNVKDVSPTDEDIDFEKPMQIEVLIDGIKDRLIFTIDQLPEALFIDFIDNFAYIKTNILSKIDEIEKTIETDKEENKLKEKDKEVLWGSIDRIKNFRSTFFGLFAKYAKCRNPEAILDSSLYFILEAEYRDEIKYTSYYTLFRELYNVNHYIISDLLKYKKDYIEKNKDSILKKLFNKIIKASKKFLKGYLTINEYRTEVENTEYRISQTKGFEMFFKEKVLPLFESFELDFLKRLVNDLLNIYITKLLSQSPIYKFIPVFKKLVKYNTYHVKKKLQTAHQAILNMSRSTQQQTMNFMLGKNLVTVKNGDTQSPELQSSEQ